MATKDQLIEKIMAADDAGDFEAAQLMADMVKNGDYDDFKHDPTE